MANSKTECQVLKDLIEQQQRDDEIGILTNESFKLSEILKNFFISAVRKAAESISTKNDIFHAFLK